MREIGRIALLARVCARSGTALAFDNGQYDNVSPDIRAWFKGVTAPNGVPCCDMADGDRTDYDFREGCSLELWRRPTNFDASPTLAFAREPV